MAAFRSGTVVSIDRALPDLVKLTVEVDGTPVSASAFPSMCGPLAPGDEVALNVTGLELGLGTGGDAFVLWNLSRPAPPDDLPGHIVKLRYTPWQLPVRSVEAPESPYHDVLKNASSMEGTPVVACSLHSQIAGVAAGIRAARPEARIGYVMTDGAALPIAWSELVRTLRDRGLIDVTCTCGHAFGGDLEAVNVFSAMLATRLVGEADVVIVAMGPGVVGTATPMGFTGIEQGQAVDAATALGGRPVGCLRVSFHDERDRHSGVSHHTLTALRVGCRSRCEIALPLLEEAPRRTIRNQLEAAGITERHAVLEVDGRPGVELLRELAVQVTSMGKSLDEIPELFEAAAAAGALAASYT
ncbi:MAG: DUF3866 family protein [Actinomycetota bacterium]|nr:DUF3866 family protein [Actinomycetota bacterium]